MKPKYIALGLTSLLGFNTVSNAFSDISIADQYYTSTTYLQQVEVFSGYEDGSFGRDKLINRAEALKVILVAAEIETLEGLSVSFSDVPAGIWFHDFIATAAKEEIVSGDAQTGLFAPGRTVNKAEFLKMLMKAFGIDPGSFELTKTATDVPEGAWFEDFFRFALEFNVITPDASGKVQPDKQLTRGEAAQLIFNIMRQGKGLDPQLLLNLTEIHLVKSFELINNETPEIGTAAILVALAENYSNYAAEIITEDNINYNIVQSAQKVTAAFKSLVQALGSIKSEDYATAVTQAKAAWALSDESRNLNPKNESLSIKLQDLAASIADKARSMQ